VKAEREFRVALDRKDDARARAFLALTLAATNRCEAATPGLTQSLESPDADLRKLGGLALVQCDLARNRFDEAAAIVSKLKAQYPSDADVLYQSARLYMR